MTTLKYLLTFVSGVIVTLFAWMALGGTDTCKAVLAQYEQTAELYQQNIAVKDEIIETLLQRIAAKDRIAKAKVLSLEREVESIKVLAAQVKPVEQAVKVSPHETEQTRAEGVTLWLRDSLNQAKAAWRGAMRVP